MINPFWPCTPAKNREKDQNDGNDTGLKLTGLRFGLSFGLISQSSNFSAFGFVCNFVNIISPFHASQLPICP
jgi:hypothetical protein